MNHTYLWDEDKGPRTDATYLSFKNSSLFENFTLDGRTDGRKNGRTDDTSNTDAWKKQQRLWSSMLAVVGPKTLSLALIPRFLTSSMITYETDGRILFSIRKDAKKASEKKASASGGIQLE